MKKNSWHLNFYTVGVIIFSLVSFYQKKNNQTKNFFFKKRNQTETGSNRPVWLGFFPV
jgi:hypothetical protein